jgi:hypothetical protein|tara:strand:+ start:257 stop:466 length:210 start_codon:yes stop_codon:yes gene_type:complete
VGSVRLSAKDLALGVAGIGQLEHLSTTTTGLSLSVMTMRLFQIMRAEHTIIARLSTWCASCRLRMSRSV